MYLMEIRGATSKDPESYGFNMLPAVEGAGSVSSLLAFHCCPGGVYVQAPFPVSWLIPQFLDFAQIGMECKSMQFGVAWKASKCI